MLESSIPSMLTETHRGSVVILEYGFSNFYSFREAASISFRLDANCPPATSLGRTFTPVLCVKGANASGKTHLLKALAFLCSFCSKSFSSKPDAGIDVEPFFASKEPSEFYIEFELGSEHFRYELEVTVDEIVREAMYRIKPKKQRLFERTRTEVIYASQTLEQLKTMKLRKNASVISTGWQYEIEQLAGFYGFFQACISNVNTAGLSENIVNINSMSDWLEKNPPIFEFVKTFIKESDVGISDIQIHKAETSEGKEERFPVFYHDSDGALYPVTVRTESTGTKALFRILGAYRLMLDSGGLLILDEFDVYLHPHILPKLLALFLGAELNQANAQIIFTTHNSEILNLLGRYRTYMVNKEDNESFTYRLDDIPGDTLRNDRQILAPYNEGKIGGIPRLSS
jgi:uncharacterized protein